MKKFEELINRRDAELESERKILEAKIREFNSKKQTAATKLIVAFIIAIISYNEGIVHWDGGLFTGFFMQLLLIASGIATVIFFVQLIVLLGKGLNG